MHKIVTISREFGSGGRELGKRLAEELGIPCYDHQIIEMIAKENGFDERYVANVSEKSIEAAYPMTIGHRFAMPSMEIMEQPIRVAAAQRQIIENFAKTLQNALPGTKCEHIITTAVEHHAVLHPMQKLEAKGFEVTYLQPDHDGNITVEELKKALRPDTILVSVMMVNNETGAINDIAAVARMLKAENSIALLHTDAVQGFLKVPFSAKTLGADMISVSGHKVHAPKGVGALFIRDSQRQTLKPPYIGGHQERGLRPGTENTPYIVGLGLAAAKGAKNLSDRNAHIRALNAQLRTGLEELAQQAPITLNSPADAVPEVLNFSTNCVNSQTFIEYLSGRHIYISGGSACDKGEPSHTLMAMGAPDLAVRTALRVSFCGDNTPEDVQALLDGLKDGLKELQHI